MRKKARQILFGSIFVVIAIAIVDTGYLTIHHFSGSAYEVICGTGFFSDCGAVLSSVYSEIFGIPLALLGILHYVLLLQLVIFTQSNKRTLFIFLSFVSSSFGFLFSLYLLFLQFVVLQQVCLLCFISACTSILLYVLIRWFFWSEYQGLLLKKTELVYKIIAKRLLFLVDPETIHETFLQLGNRAGRNKISRKVVRNIFRYESPVLTQTLHGLSFHNPLGLSAGYDYEAMWPQLSGAVGFGFTTIGTISNIPYAGNKKPRLGRLPKSKSLLVNKGFRNPGAKEIVRRLDGLDFDIPVGISIGRTNRVDISDQTSAIADIISTFETFEDSQVNHAYYELNISCPNLQKGISLFSSIKELRELLIAVGSMKIKRPIFVKMPIDKTDKHTLKMVESIHKHGYEGVIFGNLQKNRQHPSIDQEEVKMLGKGNFSGKPTFERSNELISLTYNEFKKDITIIGCGGIFNAQDAFEKIIRGASLLQLITGMIFQGPQMMTQLNRGLTFLLKKHGFKHISKAIGAKHD